MTPKRVKHLKRRYRRMHVFRRLSMGCFCLLVIMTTGYGALIGIGVPRGNAAQMLACARVCAFGVNPCVVGVCANVPSVSTQAVTAITQTTATGNGTVTSNGGDAVTERGIVLAIGTIPTVNDMKFVAALAGVGVYTASLTSLTANTLYQVRAYAINSIGTAYGSTVTFTTEPAPVISPAAPIAPAPTGIPGASFPVTPGVSLAPPSEIEPGEPSAPEVPGTQEPQPFPVPVQPSGPTSGGSVSQQHTVILRVTSDPYVINDSGSVDLETTITSPEKGAPRSVSLTFRLYDAQGNMFFSEQKNVLVSDLLIDRSRAVLKQGLAPGIYRAEVELLYNGARSVATSSFESKQRPIIQTPFIALGVDEAMQGLQLGIVVVMSALMLSMVLLRREYFYLKKHPFQVGDQDLLARGVIR